MTALIIILMIALYFLPTIVAWNRKKPDGPIVINLFLGWTFIGWVIALAWAFNLDPKEKKQERQESQTPWKRWN